MKVNYSVEIDSNEINATINGVKDLLGFIVAQKKQDDTERRIAELDDRFISKKLTNGGMKKILSRKNNCK